MEVNRLAALLRGYDNMDKNILVAGFTYGFRIPSTISKDPPKHGYTNHQSVLVHMDIVQAKIDKEISKGRISGPHDHPPLTDMIISPLGLVPKKDPGDYRVIHDLSFPKSNSVNSHIDPCFSGVEYEVLDNCVAIIQSLGRGCLIAKADLQDAFRLIPIHPTCHRLLGFIWNDKYFYDRCLPMGCSTSCQTFEKLSKALQWIPSQKFSVTNMSHILFFGSPQTDECQLNLNSFFQLANHLCLPIKESKTVFPTTTATLHGIEVDTLNMSMRLPKDKVESAIQDIKAMYKRKKVSLRDIQSLIGTLNFACRVITPGRAFLRRLISLTVGVKKRHHLIWLTKEARLDLSAWLIFLQSFNGISMLLPNKWTSSNEIRMYSDASGAGFAAILGSRWFQGQFPPDWQDVNIAIKELLPVVLAMKLWGPALLKNSRILFFCDNESVVYIINAQTSKDPVIMKLVRSLVVTTMTFNIHIRAKHIKGRHNVLADMLSRFQVQEAHATAPWLRQNPELIPQEWLPW